MIPKRIHYCWFGGKKKPASVRKCIESWKKFCPDYEIIEWNEENYNINKNAYTKTAHEQRQYAFLSDYVRLDVVYEYGGFYLDTDVELVKSLDNLRTNQCFMGMEEAGVVATGLGFGAVAYHPFIRENRKQYEIYRFTDEKGKLLKIPCPRITSKLLELCGMVKENICQEVAGVRIYSTEFFCPIKLGHRKAHITENTYSIHHFDASWKSKHRILRKISYSLIPLKKKIKEGAKSLKTVQSRKDFAVYVYFAIIAFCKGAGLDGSNKLYLTAYAIACLFMAYKAIHEQYILKEVIILISLLAIGVACLVVGHNTAFLFTAISVVGLKNTNTKKIAKVMFWCLIIPFAVISALALLGFLGKTKIPLFKLDGTYFVRNTLGYTHPNTPHALFLIALFLLYLSYDGKNSLLIFIAALIIDYLLYTQTVSRTSFLIVALFIIIVSLVNISKLFAKFIRLLSLIIYPFFMILSIVLALNFNNPIVRKLDLMLTGRIYYTYELITNIEPPIVGAESYTIETTYQDKGKINLKVLFDNSYFALIYRFGILATIAFYALIINLSIIEFRNKNSVKIPVLLVFTGLLCFTESFIMNIVMNPALIFAGATIYRKNNKAKKISESNTEPIDTSFNTGIRSRTSEAI